MDPPVRCKDPNAPVPWRRHRTGRLIASGANQAPSFSRKVTSAERRRRAYLRLAPRCDAGIYWQGPGWVGDGGGMFLQLTRHPHPLTPTPPFLHMKGAARNTMHQPVLADYQQLPSILGTSTPAQANFAYRQPQKCTLINRPPNPRASDCEVLRCQLRQRVCQGSDSQHAIDIPVS